MLENKENKENKEIDYLDIAKKMVENPLTTENILDELPSILKLNPIIKSLIYIRRNPKEVFVDEKALSQITLNIPLVIDRILDMMGMDNYRYGHEWETTNQDFNVSYVLDNSDLAEILLFNPEQIELILKSIDAQELFWILENLQMIEDNLEKYVNDKNNINTCLENIHNVQNVIESSSNYLCEIEIQGVNNIH